MTVTVCSLLTKSLTILRRDLYIRNVKIGAKKMEVKMQREHNKLSGTFSCPGRYYTWHAPLCVNVFPYVKNAYFGKVACSI